MYSRRRLCNLQSRRFEVMTGDFAICISILTASLLENSKGLLKLVSLTYGMLQNFKLVLIFYNHIIPPTEIKIFISNYIYSNLRYVMPKHFLKYTQDIYSQKTQRSSLNV